MTNSRYSRQELFAGIGCEGQARLGTARVVVVGCGALGSVASEMMVRAGVRSLTVVDRRRRTCARSTPASRCAG